MPETTVLKVLLHCHGCVAKVKKHVARLEGIEAFHVDQKNQKVTVVGNVKPQIVLDKVLGAGKTAEYWPQPQGNGGGGGGGNQRKEAEV